MVRGCATINKLPLFIQARGALPSASMTLNQQWDSVVHAYQNPANYRCKFLTEGDEVKIRLAGHEGECLMRKTSLIEKSGFFRAMLTGGFQEASSGTCTLHDDDAGGVILMLRYILDEESVPYACSMIHSYTGVKRHELINAALITADKYDVPGFTRILVNQLLEDLRFSSTSDLLKRHFNPLRAACGGSYPQYIYPAFASALETWNGAAAKVDGTHYANTYVGSLKEREATRLANELKAAAMEDSQLVVYLLGRVKL